MRKPLGLTLTEEEIADDADRRHFCAIADGAVIGSVSLKPLGPHTLQLRQMAVADGRQGEGIGARLLAYAEDWARRSGYGVIILNARIGAEASTRGSAIGAKARPSTRIRSRISG